MALFQFRPLDAEVHDREAFDCGASPLNFYLQRQARKDAERHLAATFVMVEEAAPAVIAGYYTLSNFSVELADLPEAMVRRLPRYPLLPATLIGRLARDVRFPGVGGLLLIDALARAYAQTAVSGSLAVVAEAMDDRAVAFYLKHGFLQLGSAGNRVFLPMETIARLAPTPRR